MWRRSMTTWFQPVRSLAAVAMRNRTVGAISVPRASVEAPRSRDASKGMLPGGKLAGGEVHQARLLATMLHEMQWLTQVQKEGERAARDLTE